MPPKKSDTVDVSSQREELKSLVNSFKDRFDRLETMLEAAKKENLELKTKHAEMKKTIDDRDREIDSLRDKFNEQEQYIRGWSVRVLNVEVPEGEVSEPTKVMQHVFNRCFLPILQGARDKGLLHGIPTAEELLETAHILPAKAGTTPPIICRFYTRNLRSLMFRLKRELAPREEPEPAGAGTASRGDRVRPGRYLYPFYEDLTRANFHKFRALSQHEAVQSCWTVNGSIRYKLKDEDTIRKVRSVFATVDDIIAAK